MPTLIYKRTHCDDPDSQTGVFGNEDCMGSKRAWPFDAVVGVGGISPWSDYKGIARKITWIGVYAKIVDCPDDRLRRGPCLKFKHFWYRGEDGPLLEAPEYPNLAHRMYDNKHTRFIIHSPERSNNYKLDQEVEKILGLAKAESRSGQLANRDFQNTHGKCR
jgi:hypothetical protein